MLQRVGREDDVGLPGRFRDVADPEITGGIALARRAHCFGGKVHAGERAERKALGQQRRSRAVGAAEIRDGMRLPLQLPKQPVGQMLRRQPREERRLRVSAALRPVAGCEPVFPVFGAVDDGIHSLCSPSCSDAARIHRRSVSVGPRAHASSAEIMSTIARAL